MKYIIHTILVIVLLVLGYSFQSLGQTTFSAAEVSENSNENAELSFVFLTKGSQETIQNTTVAELNDKLIQILSDSENVDTIRTVSSEIVVSPSKGNYLGGSGSDEYAVNIRGGILGNGWDITSVTLNGVEVSNIIIQSSIEVVVIPAAGTPGTGDVVITSTSKGKTTVKNGFTYTLNPPAKQAKNIQFSNENETSAEGSNRRFPDLFPDSMTSHRKSPSIQEKSVLFKQSIKTEDKSR